MTLLPLKAYIGFFLNEYCFAWMAYSMSVSHFKKNVIEWDYDVKLSLNRVFHQIGT